MTARAFLHEDRSQSHGSEITSKLDQLLAIRVKAERLPEPSPLAVEVVTRWLAGAGLSLSPFEATDFVRFVLAADQYTRPAAPVVAGPDARD